MAGASATATSAQSTWPNSCRQCSNSGPFFGVHAVVRLNMPQYGRAGFEEKGFAVLDLNCEDRPPILVTGTYCQVSRRCRATTWIHSSALQLRPSAVRHAHSALHDESSRIHGAGGNWLAAPRLRKQVRQSLDSPNPLSRLNPVPADETRPDRAKLLKLAEFHPVKMGNPP